MSNIVATQIVSDFNRRKIEPDWIKEVSQGYLRLWRLGLDLIPELLIGSDNGKSIPGTLAITGNDYYINTYSAQDIADDLMVKSKLTKADVQLLTPSQMGKIGGSVKSEAKLAASRENGKKGGRPKKIKDEK